MEERLGEQITKLKPLLSGISDDAGTLARWELRYIQKVLQEGVRGIPRLIAAALTAALLSVLAIITLAITIAHGISSAAHWPLWASFGIVTLLLALGAAAAVYFARRWVGPQLNVFNRLREHWQRCFSAAWSSRSTASHSNLETTGYTSQERYRSEVH